MTVSSVSANSCSSGHSQDVRTAVASHDNSRLASGGNDRVPMVRIGSNGGVHCFLEAAFIFSPLCRFGMLVLVKSYVI